MKRIYIIYIIVYMIKHLSSIALVSHRIHTHQVVFQQYFFFQYSLKHQQDVLLVHHSPLAPSIWSEVHWLCPDCGCIPHLGCESLPLQSLALDLIPASKFLHHHLCQTVAILWRQTFLDQLFLLQERERSLTFIWRQELLIKLIMISIIIIIN